MVPRLDEIGRMDSCGTVAQTGIRGSVRRVGVVTRAGLPSVPTVLSRRVGYVVTCTSVRVRFPIGCDHIPNSHSPSSSQLVCNRPGQPQLLMPIITLGESALLKVNEVLDSPHIVLKPKHGCEKHDWPHFTRNDGDA